jgi:VWFA-related protein
LQRIASETGGEALEVSKNATIEQVYARIEEARRNQYSIGYTPERPSADGKYHKIKPTTKDAHLIVKTRDGYYGT